MSTVQISFGLFASNKHPTEYNACDVESTVAAVAKSGTMSSSNTLVFDSYEVLVGKDSLRAFLDLDIKRWLDRSPISKLDGVVLTQHIKDALEEIVPILEERYGRILVGNSSGSKSKTEYCVSFRVWFPCIVGSRRAIQLFSSSISSEFLSRIQSSVGDFQHRVNWDSFFDNSVYKNMGKLRLPGCTKQGEKYRPLLLDPELSSVGWDYTDSLVTWWKEEEVVYLPTPEPDIESPSDIGFESETKDKPLEIKINLVAKLTDSQFLLISELAGLLTTHWDKNSMRFQIIAALWSLEPSSRMRDFIHSQTAAKNPDNKPCAIDHQISRIQFEGVGVKTILKHAWDSNKSETLLLKQKYPDEWIYFFGTSANSSNTFVSNKTLLINELVVQEKKDLWTLEVYSDRYVRPYPFRDWDTIAVQSQMGTGKTVQLFDVIKAYDRILVLSARRSYSAFIKSELLTMELQFVNYMDVKGHLSGYNKLILQVESLHRISWAYEPYDLVVMDESESLLFQMNSTGTHRDYHKENYDMLERVVRDAKKVIAMDAFVTDRTLFFLDTMRVSESVFVYSESVSTLLENSTRDVYPEGQTIAS